MRQIRQGDVFWLDFGPALNSAPAGRRPCIVVQGDLFNRSRIGSVVVCLITSNMARAKAPGNVALKEGEANLPKPGVVNVSQIVTVDRQELSEYIGHLPAHRIDSIREGLRLLFERV